MFTILGGVLAAGAAGSFTGAAGSAVPADIRVGLATAGAVALAVLPHIRSLRVPQFDRETAQSLLGLGPRRWGLMNGTLLGLGFTNRLGTWCWFAVPYFAFVIGSSWAGAVLWGGYALTRLVIAVALAVVMKVRPGEESMGRLSASVLRLRAPAMKGLSLSFSAVMLALSIHLGVNGFQPSSGWVTGEAGGNR